MNGYERVRAAVEGRRPDRVPAMLHNFLMAADEAGYTQGQYRESAAVMADSHTRAVERYGYDGVMLEMDTAVMAGALGVPVAFPAEEPARTVRPLLERLEDVGRLKSVRVESYRYLQTCLEAVRLLVERFHGQVYVRGNCDQLALSLATMVRGAAEFYMDLCNEEKEALVHELLEYCTEAALQYIRLMAQTGCDMVSNGDSPAGPDLISPDWACRTPCTSAGTPPGSWTPWSGPGHPDREHRPQRRAALGRREQGRGRDPGPVPGVRRHAALHPERGHPPGHAERKPPRPGPRGPRVRRLSSGVNQHGAQRVRVGSRADVLMPPGSVVTINPGEVHSSRVVGEDGK